MKSDIHREIIQRQLQDIQLPLTVDLKETANRQRILFRALYSAARQSLRKNIFVRACGFLFPVVFRQEATRIKTV